MQPKPIEIVLSNKSSTSVKAILVDGISPRGKLKREFLSEGCFIAPSEEVSRLIFQNENEKYLKDWEEIDEEHWCNALEELPPLRYSRVNGYLFFFCSEAYTGNIHSCYCEVDDRYYMTKRRLTMNYEDMIEEIKEIYEPSKNN